MTHIFEFIFTAWGILLLVAVLVTFVLPLFMPGIPKFARILITLALFLAIGFFALDISVELLMAALLAWEILIFLLVPWRRFS